MRKKRESDEKKPPITITYSSECKFVDSEGDPKFHAAWYRENLDWHEMYDHTADGLKRGWYAPGREFGTTNLGEYNYVSGWRRTLCKMAVGVPLTKFFLKPIEGSYFEDLLSVSPHLVVFGPVTAAKVLSHFDQFEERAEALSTHGSVHPQWMNTYRQLQHGFRVAAGKGWIRFK